jgi:hypothetical protein
MKNRKTGDISDGRMKEKTWIGLFIFISPILDTELWGDPKGGTWWM